MLPYLKLSLQISQNISYFDKCKYFHNLWRCVTEVQLNHLFSRSSYCYIFLFSIQVTVGHLSQWRNTFYSSLCSLISSFSKKKLNIENSEAKFDKFLHFVKITLYRFKKCRRGGGLQSKVGTELGSNRKKRKVAKD